MTCTNIKQYTIGLHWYINKLNINHKPKLMMDFSTSQPLMQIANNAFVLPVPTLQRLAGFKVATTLWKCNYSVSLKIFNNSNHSDGLNDYEWAEFAQHVSALVDHLKLPATLKQRLALCIYYVGYSLRYWLRTFRLIHFYSIRSDEPENNWIRILRSIKYTKWTIHGRVDVMNTQRALLRSEHVLTRIQKYEIACSIGLVNAIEYLDAEIPYERWKKCIIENGCLRSYMRSLIALTNAHEHGEELNVQLLLQYAARCNNLILVKYCWNLLSKEDRNNFLNWLINHRISPYSSDINVFILSQMSEKQLDDFSAFCVLRTRLVLWQILLHWGGVDTFLNLFQRIYDSLPEEQIHIYLAWLANIPNLRVGCAQIYRQLFVKVWGMCSSNIRHYVADQERNKSEILKFSVLQWRAQSNGELIELEPVLIK